MDGSHFNESINLKEEYITVDNILSFFDKYRVPSHFDVLSIDLDMFDWWILERILNKGAYRPRVIVVEVNPTLGHYTDTNSDAFSHFNSLPLVVTHPHHTDQTFWDHSRYFGGNPKSFQLLGETYGYELLYCESCGVNCFLVQQSVLPESCRSPPPPRIHRPCYYHARGDNSTAYGHAPDSLKRQPLLLTEDLLRLDVHALPAEALTAFSLARGALEQEIGDDDGYGEDALDFKLFFLVNFLIFVSFLYFFCYVAS